MTVLVVSDVTVAAPVGYVFIAPLLPNAGNRGQVTAPVHAIDSHAILWRMQSVPAYRVSEGKPLGQASEAEMYTVDSLLKALLGL
ncbi:mRNA-degrading endonuclease toxin of MazEF toxin-antitoxin module [Nocardiopsis mwathae]|uniref:mRNA-degrading endonuclease toxin of MazEF toxin-antitoxin module n=1 Tax=Nocardiopsis mwathae TaxID=1472723 RepID=A0A7W9YKB6_9ACTN|nr:hypothetical protein [Nocardiopsis mwathae]MBB6173617.1 mRNA-degrading endonuclease toxin of MazEF toxin-antitoxin module [Nocardiopsis mwathae]